MSGEMFGVDLGVVVSRLFERAFALPRGWVAGVVVGGPGVDGRRLPFVDYVVAE